MQSFLAYRVLFCLPLMAACSAMYAAAAIGFASRSCYDHGTSFMPAAAVSDISPLAAQPQTGRHRIVSELGRGGMGAVYRAIEDGTGRVVALKTLELNDPTAVALFEREYHTLASLQHPSVIQVYDFGIANDGRRYYTMELLEGDDLMSLAPVPWRKLCEYLRDAAASLALLHARRMLHRDVSPRNIRLNAPDGRAKLLDFGAVAAFGVPTTVVGTPACIAPEVMRQVELDQRTDLFSLGVVAYWALTGARPFPIYSMRDLETGHRAPTPLSQHVPDLPRELEQLVLSMLSVEPRARPNSAAEVIERLSTLADLGEAPLDNAVPHDHLVNTILCGREREKAQLVRHLQQALGGQGGVVMVDSAPGMGRSRVASELLIDARLLGLTTLRVDATAHSEPNGVMRALARQLLQSAPQEATETLGARLAVLGQVFDELKQHAHAAPQSAPLPVDPVERRARVQSTFLQWFLAVAERRPIAVVNDDAHSCDVSSAGVLVALAHAAQHRRILLVTTQVTGAPAPIGVQKLARIGARIKLRALAQPAMAQLVASAFGDVPNRARLTQWLCSVGHGNPGQSLELLASLISRGVIRYVSGAWDLPAQLSERDLPASLEEALSARLALLEPNALTLAQLFALHQGSLSVRLCAELLPQVSRGALFSALDDLIAGEIVAASGDDYRLREGELRRLLLQPLAADAVRALHLSLARAQLVDHRDLLDEQMRERFAQLSAAELGLLLQAGWHLLRGGDELRGRNLLRDAGIELAHRGDALAEAVPALEAALELYHKQARTREECGYLLVPLTLAGSYSDFRQCYRHAAELLPTLLDTTGFSLARRLSPRLGYTLALLIALPLAFVRFWLRRPRIAHDFSEAFLGLISIATSVIATAMPLSDRRYAKQLEDWLRPLSAFPRRHAARITHDFQRALVAATIGTIEEARRLAQRALVPLQQTGGVASLPETARVQLEAGVLILLGNVEAYRLDGSVHATLDSLDRVHSPISRQSAAGVRANYYAMRGEQSRHEHYAREVDVLAAQSGSTWRQDVLSPRNLWSNYALCEDVMSLKRCARQLEALAEDVPSLTDSRDAARACYLSERGRQDEALTQYGAMLTRVGAENAVTALRYIGLHARILRRAGRAAEARDLCAAALARSTPEQLEFELVCLSAQLEHALALTDLGATAQATRALDQLVDSHPKHDNALVHGAIFRVRAQVALTARNPTDFDRYLEAMYQWFLRSDNPALIAQCRTLADEGRRSGLIDASRRYSAQPEASSNADIAAVRHVLGRCRGPVERLDAALELVTAKAAAERGYLYLLEPAGLRFVAPSVGLEPPEELQQELFERLRRFMREDDDTVAMKLEQPDDLRTLIQPSDDSPRERSIAGQPYRALLLLIAREGELIAVGAVALVRSDDPLAAVSFSFLEEVARGIYDAGDVQTVVHIAAARRSSRAPR